MATARNPKDSEHFMLTYYCALYAILYYDYLCTIHKEYRRIWKANWSIVKILFFVNRYLMLLESVLIFVGFSVDWTTDKCSKTLLPWQTLIPVIISAAGGILLLLRTYAMWSNATWVLLVLTPLLLGQLATNTYLASTQVRALPFDEGHGPCMTFARNLPIMDLYCIIPFLYDLAASALCIFRAVKLRRQFGDHAGSLLRNFVVHGTFYVVGTAVANVANLIFMALTVKQLDLATVASNGGLMCTVFCSIFISRLCIALKSDVKNSTTLEEDRECGVPLNRITSPSSCGGSSMAKISYSHSRATSSASETPEIDLKESAIPCHGRLSSRTLEPDGSQTISIFADPQTVGSPASDSPGSGDPLQGFQTLRLSTPLAVRQVRQDVQLGMMGSTKRGRSGLITIGWKG